MSALRTLRSACGALACALAVTLPAYAGGPFAIVDQQPVRFPNGAATITLNLDRGTLGARSNAQATTLVQNAIAPWNAAGTSTVKLVIGSSLGQDYTGANFADVYGNAEDGLNPVLFDNDGTILDALLGAGSRNYLLGFGGANYTSTGRYTEGRIIVNGYLNTSDARLTTVIAHEIGHLIGLDHAQLDDDQGLSPENYPLMYPVVLRSTTTLHEDDLAALSALYPASSAAATYGRLQGTFTAGDGTPILGANIWAVEVSTRKVYSVVSDYLMQRNGYFSLSLPAGTYELHANSVRPGYVGASSVGPYARTDSDESFQSPHPIVPVAFGGSTAQLMVISAGCTATATFHLDGSGNVTGNCGSSTPPTSGNKAGSGNATLSSMSLTSAALSPSFAPATMGYRASVGPDVATINVTPTPADATATIKVNGFTVAPGRMSNAIALSVGDTPVRVVVTSADGATTRTYTVTVTRAAAPSAPVTTADFGSRSERGTGMPARR